MDNDVVGWVLAVAALGAFLYFVRGKIMEKKSSGSGTGGSRKSGPASKKK